MYNPLQQVPSPSPTGGCATTLRAIHSHVPVSLGPCPQYCAEWRSLTPGTSCTARGLHGTGAHGSTPTSQARRHCVSVPCLTRAPESQRRPTLQEFFPFPSRIHLIVCRPSLLYPWNLKKLMGMSSKDARAGPTRVASHVLRVIQVPHETQLS